ncbi:Protein MIZU-KUSSEI like [Actinidia chinensis var. chinensis]|uniref:Protein MIZU-KUSSEI like n=1 Tax=Actinidia chinensis var. chinensis TaxID=1590841 RepID=A0A2R6RMY0_ACTCC|nr:Protein MIZU-KUSSEI like [Actinidia chinensis var. chinensis]
MPPVHSSPYCHMENPTLLSLLHHTATATTEKRSAKRTSTTGGLLRMFKLFPMLTSGCKMVALLAAGRPRKSLLADRATTGTLFGHRKGRLTLTIQEDPHRLPVFVIELPLLTAAFHKEMASDVVRIALESETKTHKKKVLEEFVWAVFCNGRKIGYSIRRKQMSEDEVHVMQLLRGVSMGAGVLPPPPSEKDTAAGDGELTYIRARFERVVGSKDSESLYMINPDEAAGAELSIFFVRVH